MMPDGDRPCDTEDWGDVNIYPGGPLTMGLPGPWPPAPKQDDSVPHPAQDEQHQQPLAREPNRKEPNWPAGSWRWGTRR